MRILVLAPHPFFSYRGTPIAVRSVVEVLGSEGYRLTLLTYNEGEDLELPNCEILRIPRIAGVHGIRPGFSLKKVASDGVMLARTLQLLSRERFDLLHAVEESVFIAMTAKAIHRIPFVYDMDSSLVQQMIDRFPVLRPVQRLMISCEKQAVRRSAGVLAVCQSLAERARDQAPGQLVGTLEDVSLLDSADQRGESLADRIGTRGPVVMYVGNLEPYQGVDLLVDAFHRALRRVPDAQLVVIGGIDADVARYASRCRDLGMGSSTHFLGPRPISQLGWFLRQAHVLVSPRNRGDNTAMKIYSYLDSGRPILATRLPTHTQVLDDEIAFLAEPDAEEMGAGLVTLLSDETMRARLARRARERVRRRFGSDSYRRKLLRFYASVERRLGRKPAERPGTAAEFTPGESRAHR